MNPKIDSIVFDLGGVLYDVDIERSVKAFALLGLKNFEQLYTLKEQVPLFDELETGRIGKEEFIDSIFSYFDTPPPSHSIIEAWSALLIGMRPENVGLLKKLSDNYKIYLLSNTNPIHLEQIDKEVETYGIAHLEDLFDKAYISYKLGMRKPDAEIYKYMIQDSGIEPSKTLYIEDSEANAQSGEKAGLKIYLSQRNTPLKEILEKLKLIESKS
jgi:HAD superfamily hydrolase (TIGR01509 family)